MTHQSLSTVVQQQNRVYEEGGAGQKVTLMAFGYQYDVIGKLEGIADWRGRGPGESAKLGLNIAHPSSYNTSYKGYHQSEYPFSDDSDNLAGPIQWNSGDVVAGTVTGWPVGVSPSDAVFGYDTLYQLESEDREYITGNGSDSQLDEDYTTIQERVRTLDWKFDPTGSMVEWLDGEDSTGNVASSNFGRALGQIKNGYQLNLERDGGACMNALSESEEMPPGCLKPEAIYFASNIDEVGTGRGTCIWAMYDTGGRMTKQIVRTGCTTCEYQTGVNNGGADAAVCQDYTPPVGSPNKPIEAKRLDYIYAWNALDQLSGAVKQEEGVTGELVMSYYYDASGARVVREKYLRSAPESEPTDIRQDLYVSKEYERRQVLLKTLDGIPETINDGGFSRTVRGIFNDIDGTRLVKYSGGVRVDRDWNAGGFGEEKWFLRFGNHLGSTSVVIDYDTGALVEWSTHYAYGADESHWRNLSGKYIDNDGFKSSEPYGFTGKEEDEEVGLHYFGARYYSSYLGRWLSPDPPVVHGGGVTNLYNYGGNSPYIYVDPDGNFIQAIVGAIVGAVVGFVSGIVQGDIKAALIGAVVGAAVGAATGGVGAAVAAEAGTMAGVVAGAAVSAGASMAQTAAQGGSIDQVFINGAVSFGAGVIGGGLGVAMGNVGNAAGQAIMGYVSSVGISYASAAITGTLNEDNWDDILFSSSVSYFIGMAGSAIGSEIEQVGMNGEGAGLQTSEESIQEGRVRGPMMGDEVGDGDESPSVNGQSSRGGEMNGRNVDIHSTSWHTSSFSSVERSIESKTAYSVDRNFLATQNEITNSLASSGRGDIVMIVGHGATSRATGTSVGMQSDMFGIFNDTVYTSDIVGAINQDSNAPSSVALMGCRTGTGQQLSNIVDSGVGIAFGINGDISALELNNVAASLVEGLASGLPITKAVSNANANIFSGSRVVYEHQRGIDVSKSLQENGF